MPHRLTAFASESVTVSTSAVGLTAASYAPAGQQAARQAFITVESDEIRYWLDGTAPTSTVGHFASTTPPENRIVLNSLSDITNFRAILDTGAGGDATLRVSYFR